MIRAEPQQTPQRRGRMPLPLLAGLALLTAAAFATGEWFIGERRGELLQGLEQRMALALAGRGATLGGWLTERRDATARFADATLPRLLLAEQAAGFAGGGATTTYLLARLNDLTREYAFDGVHLLDADGEPLLASAAAPPADDALRRLAGRAVETAAAAIDGGSGEPPRLWIAVPVRPLQPSSDGGEVGADGGGTLSPIGAVVATVPFAEPLHALTASRQLGLPSERLQLLTRRDDHTTDTLSATDDGRYRLERPVAATPWRLRLEVSVHDALAPLAPFRLSVRLAAGLFCAFAALLPVMVWLRQRGEGARALSAQYRRLAETMETQNRLIEEINSAVGEHISLKGPDGAYRYANQAFAAALGLTPAAVEGRHDGELFNSRDARRLGDLDRITLEQRKTVHAAATLRVGGGMRHFELSKTPFRGLDGEEGGTGIVTVARDVTDLIEQKRRSEMLIKQTTTAIGYLSEASDLPHFTGQARMVSKVATGIARRLGLSAEVVTTLEIAANLCHIGKLSLPPAIRLKEGRFTAEEFELMKEQMADADRLLGEIAFGLPVREAVVQMYERLDGSGYPSGLIGDDICPEARILGVANVFVAHISARPYREALSVESALEYLRGNPGQFDAEVVDALVRLVEENRRKAKGNEGKETP
ncbi:HD-GYP domain-containing protein [Endothiovibrio diazotrophicus]